MGSLIEELARREAAARAEADRLRAGIERLSEDLARAEEQASRLAIAREGVTRVLGDLAAADPGTVHAAGAADHVGRLQGHRDAPGGARATGTGNERRGL
jgi:hypothetical protein